MKDNVPAWAAPAHSVLLRDGPGGGWRLFENPAEVLCARAAAEVAEVIRRVEDAVDRRGMHAAGFLAYEAAPAFDAALTTRPAGPCPAAWFGLYLDARAVENPVPGLPPAAPAPAWAPVLPRDAYGDALRAIKRYLASGDTYQVNYTFRLRAACRPRMTGARATPCASRRKTARRT